MGRTCYKERKWKNYKKTDYCKTGRENEER
jgi:hypothetical protein